jgi:hypothetical protein
MKTTILRFSAIGLATMGMGIGIAAASTASISNTGPDSSNNATITNSNSGSITNNNNLSCQGEHPSFLIIIQPENCGIANLNSQFASSGDATVDSNTNAGSARSGNADNHASSSTSINLTNGSGVPAGFFGGSDNVSIHTTGPSSSNDASISNSNSWSVENTNNVAVTNLNEQCASSGSGSVTNNTNGGSASTGGASNTSSTSTNVTIHN